jgi:methylmalonyl-CoA/ethylmalonyl-CoA epimerase
MAGIHGFDHFVIRMEDFDAGLTAYSKLFPAGPREVGEHSGMGLKMAYFDLPNGGSIEIVAPTRADSVLRPALDKDGPGMNLIAYQCEDLAATVKMMKSNGVRVIEDRSFIKVHPKSTHGILMQLVEKTPDATTANKAHQVPDTSGERSFTHSIPYK